MYERTHAQSLTPRPIARPWWLASLGIVLILGGVLALVYACASKATVDRTLVLKAVQNTNYGRPMYVLIRTVNEKDFFTDSYKKIATMVYPNSDDPSVLKVALIWPNRERRIKVAVPKDKAIGVYCLFTRPGDPWKLLFSPPMKSEYRAVLDKNSISGQ